MHSMLLTGLQHGQERLLTDAASPDQSTYSHLIAQRYGDVYILYQHQ